MIRKVLLGLFVFTLGGCSLIPGCSGGGETSIMLEKKIDELVIVYNEDVTCDRNIGMAYSRGGEEINLCDLENHILIGPDSLVLGKDFAEMFPIAKALGLVEATPDEKADLKGNYGTLRVHANSAYWAGRRRSQYFLDKYINHEPYPNAGDLAFEGELLYAE